MARPRTIRAPTTASLPSTLRIPSSSPSVLKLFTKLSRPTLLNLVLKWLDDKHIESFPPFLERDEGDNDDEDTSPYPAEKTVSAVRNAYQDLQERKGGKREVIDRILEGDWRHGITLRQLAMVDISYMEDHPASLRWTALELVRMGVDGNGQDSRSGDGSNGLPRIHASTFMRNLQQLVAPLVKAHYHLARSVSLPLTFLRILVTNSPYQNPRQLPESLADSSRVIYIAFPDSCPYVYTSISSTGSGPSTSTSSAVGTDTRSLQRLVRDAIPKALSRPQERYNLEPTSLTAKNIQALLALRGPGRSNAANGSFSIFADAVIEGSPLDPRPSNTVSPEEYMNQTDGEKEKENKRPNEDDSKVPDQPKKRKLAVHARFGTTGSLSSAPLDRLDVRMLDPPDNSNRSYSETQPAVSLSFSGSDVISGIRKLAELGIVNPERMPSWMTGEEGVSVAVVQRGQVTKDR